MWWIRFSSGPQTGLSLQSEGGNTKILFLLRRNPNMALNVSKNSPALLKAYKDVVDGSSATNWALFTYEGNSNDVRLAATGDGGLEEMVEELSSGKVMYAFCRVQDPNSGLPKYVLINWTGEGVKDSRKGICANHVCSIANFLKGAHVTINARGDDDVEPESILEKVAKASGANFHFHKASENRDARRAAVGSVYQKVNAVEEIQQTKKDDFWVQTQREEAVRQQEENQRVDEERRVMEMKRREMEENQRMERERKAKERAQQIEEDRIHQKQKEEEERESEQQQNQQKNEERKSGINFTASVQKANEAKSLISQRTFNPRDVFKQREQSFESPSGSKPGKSSSQRKTQLQPQYPPAPAVVPLDPVSPGLAHSPATPPEITGPPVETAEPNFSEGEEDWSDEFEDDGDEAAAEENLYEAPHPTWTETDEDLYEDVIQQDISTAGDGDVDMSGQTISGQTISARALYDYQAVDDTEITFDPDDIISGIEMVDEGWWRGYGPNGQFGMFPANYVELL